MNFRILLAVFGSGLVLNIGFTGTPKTDDAKSIQGVWRIVSLTKGGDKDADNPLKNMQMRITADRLVLLEDGKEVDPLPYRLNPAKKPKEIDFIAHSFRKKGGKEEKVEDVMPGIYSLMGDDLIICWTIPRQPPKDKDGKGVEPDKQAVRPKDFKDAGALLLVLKRDK